MSGSALVLTSTFQVPCIAAATSARATAARITPGNVAMRPGTPAGAVGQSDWGMTDKYFEPLVGLDTWFLYAERHEAPLHIGATYIFDGTPRVKGGRGALGLARTI